MCDRGVCVHEGRGPVNKIKDRCKNITFPQLRFPTVITRFLVFLQYQVKVLIAHGRYLGYFLKCRICLLYEIQ